MDKEELTFEGLKESDYNFERAIDYDCQWFWSDPMSSMTGFVYEFDMRPFINTYSNIKTMIQSIWDANPHLKYSFEPIERKVSYWYKQNSLNGKSWRRVSAEITHKMEMDCMYSFGVYYNPYYELDEKDVLDIENKLRAEMGLDPINKWFEE